MSKVTGKISSPGPQGLVQDLRVYLLPPPLITSHSAIPGCNKYEGICEKYEGICEKYKEICRKYEEIHRYIESGTPI